MGLSPAPQQPPWVMHGAGVWDGFSTDFSGLWTSIPVNQQCYFGKNPRPCRQWVGAEPLQTPSSSQLQHVPAQAAALCLPVCSGCLGTVRSLSPGFGLSTAWPRRAHGIPRVPHASLSLLPHATATVSPLREGGKENPAHVAGRGKWLLQSKQCL